MRIDASLQAQRAFLMILLAAAEKALEAFQAADNPVDEEFVADLEAIVERTRRELWAIVERLAEKGERA